MIKNSHCVKSVQIRSFFWSVYGVSLCIQSEYGKIRTRKKSVFGHFSHSVSLCSSIISVPISILFHEILYLYSQIVGLLKTSQKMFLTKEIIISFLTVHIRQLRGQKHLKSTLLVIFHQGCH